MAEEASVENGFLAQAHPHKRFFLRITLQKPIEPYA